MRAIRIHGFGGIGTMRLDEIPRPVPEPLEPRLDTMSARAELQLAGAAHDREAMSHRFDAKLANLKVELLKHIINDQSAKVLDAVPLPSSRNKAELN